MVRMSVCGSTPRSRTRGEIDGARRSWVNSTTDAVEYWCPSGAVMAPSYSGYRSRHTARLGIMSNSVSIGYSAPRTPKSIASRRLNPPHIVSGRSPLATRVLSFCASPVTSSRSAPAISANFLTTKVSGDQLGLRSQ